MPQYKNGKSTTPKNVRIGLKSLLILVAKKDIIMWGGNGSQVHSVSRPDAKPHKRHNILSLINIQLYDTI